MPSFLTKAATVIVAACSLIATFNAHADCSLVQIRLGLFDSEDCRISEEDLRRALKAFEYRREGLKIVAYEPPEPPPLPDLRITDLDANLFPGTIDLGVRVSNAGTGDADSSAVSAVVEFHRVSILSIQTVGPVARSVQALRAGDSALINVSPISIPQPGFTYDVVLTLSTDSGNDVKESNETNNEAVYVCRLLGSSEVIHPTSAEWDAGLRYCSGL